MKVYKITAEDGAEFFCNKELDLLCAIRKLGVCKTESMGMTEKEYHDIPATNRSAELFKENR